MRRAFILIACLSCIITLTSYYSTNNTPLRIATHLWPGYEFMFLARQEGWLNKHVQLLETLSATDSLQALRTNMADGAALTLDEVLRARAEGIQLTVVLIFDISAGADMLLAKPNINKLADLKGKHIALEQGALGEIMLTQALKAASLKPTDVTQISLSINQHKRAWQDPSIDAIITYEPIASQLIAQGANDLFDSRQTPNLIIDTLAIRQSAIHKYKDEIKHLIAVHFKALDQFNHNLQDASYRMSTHLQVTPQNVSRSYKGLTLPNSLKNHQIIENNIRKLINSTKILSDIMINAHILNHPDNRELLFSTEFLPHS